jgi:hypothetical protein
MSVALVLVAIDLVVVPKKMSFLATDLVAVATSDFLGIASSMVPLICQT